MKCIPISGMAFSSTLFRSCLCSAISNQRHAATASARRGPAWQVVEEADTLIVATGAVAKRLHFPGADALWNKGISACAVCDGAAPIFRGKPLAVVGGGDTAMEEANFLSKYGSQASELLNCARRRSHPACCLPAKPAKIKNSFPLSCDGGGYLLLPLIAIGVCGAQAGPVPREQSDAGPRV